KASVEPRTRSRPIARRRIPGTGVPRRRASSAKPCCGTRSATSSATKRYRDSFYVMRSALAAHPNSDMTRRIQQEAARTFDTLFLGGKGDQMPAIDALALFYDFRELTPIGR